MRKVILYIIKVIFIIINTSSCFKKDKIPIEKCQMLSMESYKGSPTATAKFKEKCQGRNNLYYTKELCQKALQTLIITGSRRALKKKYGSKIMNCFTQNDLKKFLN